MPLTDWNNKIQTVYFKPFAAKYLDFNWKTGLFLLVVFSVSRFILALQANITKNYQIIALIFVLMILAPFILLTKEGRKRIGMVYPKNAAGIVLGGISGAGCCTLMYLLATSLFGLGEGNWFVYISKKYSTISVLLNDDSRLTFFLIFSGTSMLFSPSGEELFYRGIIHESFAASFGNKVSSVIDSTAFALVHLAHFGIVYTAEGFELLPFPAFLWVISLFLSCLFFYKSRIASGSILGSIVSHAMFNLAMNYFIFYHIL
jgi:membrane protease YdiL (CAAX protease family)